MVAGDWGVKTERALTEEYGRPSQLIRIVQMRNNDGGLAASKKRGQVRVVTSRPRRVSEKG